jgi:hypothetical protein
VFEVIHVAAGVLVLGVLQFASSRLVQIDQVAAVLHHEVPLGEGPRCHHTPSLVREDSHLEKNTTNPTTMQKCTRIKAGPSETLEEDTTIYLLFSITTEM